MRRRNPLHALQGLEPALSLARLRRLGAEAFHERFHVLDFALLAREQSGLLRPLGRSLILDRGLIAAISTGLNVF